MKPRPRRKPAPQSPPPNPKSTARHAAIKALMALDTQDKPLNALLDESPLEPAARGFAREIAAGAVRHRAKLDHSLIPLLRTPLPKLDAAVRAALRLAAYERFFLSTPPHVIADEYAGAMRAQRLTSAVAFVNAVARRLPDVPIAAPDAAREPAQHLATEYSHPVWLVQRWLERLGFDECRALCESNNSIAPLCLRVNTLRATREEVLAALQEREVQARASGLALDGIVITDGGDPTRWPEWGEGLVLAQDEAAQLVAPFAHPREGMTVIDAAAAPGGKTTHLAQLMRNMGRVLACDPAPGRIKLIEQNAQRLGTSIIEPVMGDFRELAKTLPKADIVLIDAPCLGTGTLRRRPDAKWRKTPEQLRELVSLQRELLDAAAPLVMNDGVLVYSTCSLEPEENEQQARAFLERHVGWELIGPDSQPAPAGQQWLQTWPHRDGCDGMFAAKLRRRSN